MDLAICRHCERKSPTRNYCLAANNKPCREVKIEDCWFKDKESESKDSNR